MLTLVKRPNWTKLQRSDVRESSGRSLLNVVLKCGHPAAPECKSASWVCREQSLQLSLITAGYCWLLQLLHQWVASVGRRNGKMRLGCCEGLETVLVASWAVRL